MSEEKYESNGRGSSHRYWLPSMRGRSRLRFVESVDMRLVRCLRYVVAITLVVVGIGFAVQPRVTSASVDRGLASYPSPSPGGYPGPLSQVFLPWVVVDTGSYPGPARPSSRVGLGTPAAAASTPSTITRIKTPTPTPAPTVP